MYSGRRELAPFLRYVHAKIAEDEEQHSFRLYVTDTLMMVAENTARFNGGNYMNLHWSELLNRKVDLRTGDEIVMDVMRDAGLSFEQQH